MVEDSTVNQPHIVSWNKEGDAFMIMDIDALQDSVLGNYFITKKYESFKRQMRNYGFERKSELRRPNTGTVPPTIFRHKHFKRGRSDLLSNIRRREVKRPPRKLSNAEDEASALRARLASVEEIQAQLRQAIQNLKDANAVQKSQISRLERNDTGKDETIEKMNFRIRSLESGLHSVIGPRYHGQHAQASPWQTQDAAFQPLSPNYSPSPPFATTQGNAADRGISMPGQSMRDVQIDVPCLPRHINMKEGSTLPDATDIDPQADLGGLLQKGSLSRQLSRQLTDQSTQSWLKEGFPDGVDFSENV